MADITLFKIDGKPIEKLISVVSKGIGTLYKPRAIKKEADAEAYKIEVIERAKSKALAEGKEIEAETYDRIQERLSYKEFRRQSNIDNIYEMASAQLASDSFISEESVDEDWSTRFFNIVEDISDEDMQKLWSQILAGEVKRPKSYSLRTLELLKNISKEEANIFMRIANFFISIKDVSFLFKGKNHELSEQFNIQYQDIYKLIEIGLLQSGDLINYSLPQNTVDDTYAFVSGKTVVIVEKKANSLDVHIPIHILTNPGNEILKLVSQTPQFKYLNFFANYIKKENISVKHGQLIQRTLESVEHTMPLSDFPQ
jgi:uncharacterized repeat protein (TIGR03899 family)